MLTDADFTYLRQLTAGQAGVQLEEQRRYAVDSRVSDLARSLPGSPTPATLVAQLRGTPLGPLHLELVEAMTTNETSFFRDRHPFTALVEAILPSLLEARRYERQLSLWSAACSSGQEPYSIAMLLKESGALTGWTTRLVASDLSRAVLAKAERGLYSSFELGRGLDDVARRDRWFLPQGNSWQVRPELRRDVDFRQVNLTGRWPALPTFDVVFLRNVLIYFDAPTRGAVLDRVRRAMRADGYLVLGSTETMLQDGGGWVRERVGASSWYRPA